MYQRILVIQKRTESSQWGYLSLEETVSSFLREGMLTRIHTSHLEAEICLRKTRDIRYWPIINSEVKDLIRNCTSWNDYLQKKQQKTTDYSPYSQ